MCITESLCCTAEIGTALLINYTSTKKGKKIDLYKCLSNVYICGFWGRANF